MKDNDSGDGKIEERDEENNQTLPEIDIRLLSHRNYYD